MPASDQLLDFARRYTEAWCSRDPARVAEHYHWTLVGTNTGPGGIGNGVRISGEEWTIGDDDLVAESQGHFDQVEYDRQLEHGVEQPRLQNAAVTTEVERRG